MIAYLCRCSEYTATCVTLVAKDVATHGMVVVKADVKGVAGMWRELTDNVNAMDSNYTVQLRELAKASTVFFFFQAEDGIRDLTVTGVQTCALPISSHNNKTINQLLIIHGHPCDYRTTERMPHKDNGPVVFMFFQNGLEVLRLFFQDRKSVV